MSSGLEYSCAIYISISGFLKPFYKKRGLIFYNNKYPCLDIQITPMTQPCIIISSLVYLSGDDRTARPTTTQRNRLSSAALSPIKVTGILTPKPIVAADRAADPWWESAIRATSPDTACKTLIHLRRTGVGRHLMPCLATPTLQRSFVTPSEMNLVKSKTMKSDSLNIGIYSNAYIERQVVSRQRGRGTKSTSAISLDATRGRTAQRKPLSCSPPKNDYISIKLPDATDFDDDI